MENMLQGGYVSVFGAKTRDELHAELVRFTKQMEFETVAATAVIDRFLGEPEFISVDNAPAAYRETSIDRGRGKRDPVSQHCKTKSVPIIWDQHTYVSVGSGELWEQQARFGYRHGISLAFHMPEGRHFWLGVDRDQPLPKDPVEVTRVVAAVHLFAAYAQEAAMKVLLPAVADPPQLTLTPRELEALRWTMDGKTAWEIGRILGIAENTVIRHAHNAARKLGCTSKHHAVVKALKFGLIG